MRKQLLAFFFGVSCVVGVSAQQLWTDFDTDSSATFAYRDGVLEAYSANPDPDSVNMTPTVMKYSRNGPSQYDVVILQVPDIQSVSDYKSGAKKIRMQVYSPYVGVAINVVFETPTATGSNWPTGRNSEYTATTTVNNGWEWLEFSYVWSPDGGASPDNTVRDMVILIDPGNFSSGTYYFDSIMSVEHGASCDTVPTDFSILEDFEYCQRNLTYDFIEGWIAIDDSIAGNNSRVGDYVRNPASGSPNNPVFGGRLIIPADLDKYRAFSIDIRDTTSDASEMILQLNGTDQHETRWWTDPADQGNWVTYTKWIPSENPLSDTADAWLSLFDAGSVNYDKFWYDNVKLVNPCMSAGISDSIMEDYECNRHLMYNYVDTLDGWHSHVENPDKSGNNTSDMCGKYVRHGDYPFPSIKGSVLANPGPNDRRAVSMMIMDPTAPSTIVYTLTDGSDTLVNVEFETTDTTWTEYVISLDSSVITASSNVLNWDLMLDPGSAQFDSIFIDNFKLQSLPDSGGTIGGIKQAIISAGVYPNPFHNTVQFEIRGLNGKTANLEIYNMEGRLIDSREVSERLFGWTAPETLSDGMYFYKIRQGNFQTQGKLVYKRN